MVTCQLSDSYFPIMDGVGMTAHNYAYWLNKKYGQSYMVAPKVKDFKDHVDYKVFRFKSVLLPGMHPYRIGVPLIDIKFQKKLKEERFDIIHAHCPFLSGQIAVKLAKKLDVPLVATFHTKYKEDFKRVLNSSTFVDVLTHFSLEFYNAADYVWVPNKATGETLKDYGFKGSYDIMPNGTDLEIPDKSKWLKYRKKGLEAIGASSDDFIMLFVGQHRWEKNVRMIIEALKILRDEGKSFKMVFAGEGYAEKDMKKLIRQYKLSNEVTFMGVVTDRKELEYLYACSDLFLFPSIYDNSPLVLQEAAAYDVPSIVVRNSSSAEGILDTVNGFLIDNTKQSLANTISGLMRYPETIQKAGKEARKSIYRNWEDIVDNVFEKYSDIIKLHKHSRTLNNISLNELIPNKLDLMYH